jgi:anaerobic magnesium-protoporphyrin IX monomethyl ester cyclase
VRRRSPMLVLDEIQQIINLGFERINIADDLFASDAQRVKEICNGIKERNLKFAWSAFARVDTVNQEMFDAMAATGCDSISFGVESGNPEMLKRIKKGIKRQQVVQAVKMCQQAGMIAHASFMVGLPGETKETLNQTADFASSLNILFGYHYLAPFPGTTLCEKVDDYDLEILTRDWSKYDANDAIVKTSALQPQDIRDFVASYELAINGLWQNMLDGYGSGTNTSLDNMRVEGHWRMNSTFKILKEDLIEKHGFIEPDLFEGSKDRALKELGRRITACTNAEERIVEAALSDFASRGYLKAETTKKGCTWVWS